MDKLADGKVKKEQAAEMLALLAAKFKVPVPQLIWHGNQRRGRAGVRVGLRRRYVIWCGPNVWRGVITSLLHEFTHVLAQVRSGGQRHGHNPNFLEDAAGRVRGLVWRGQRALVRLGF